MHVFLDTNLLYQDYFFANKSNKNILDYCKRELINLYISDIVRLELRRQFQKEIESKNATIRKLNKDFSKLKLATSYPEISSEDLLKEFDLSFKELSILDNFHILPYKNDFLPDIVDRAINRRKPFTEEKTELKDAIIWKTYADYVESHDLSECIFLTNNTSDFCKGKEKSEIHPELLKDTKKFTLINDAFTFIKNKGSILESPEYQFQQYINQITIDDAFALFVVNNHFIDDVSEVVLERTNKLHPSDIVKQFIIDGQVIGHEVDVSECEETEYEVLGEKALISGKLYTNCEAEVLEYNASRDHGEEQYSAVADKYITYIVHFNFDLSADDTYDNFEITDIEIYTVD